MQKNGRKPAKPSSSQAPKEEGEHYLPLDHGKGDRSGHEDKPSGGEYSALSNSKVRKNPTIIIIIPQSLWTIHPHSMSY